MTKLTYRGVSYDSKDVAATDHRHEPGLRYRGVEYDGAAAERDAKPKAANMRKIYRGVVTRTEA